MPSSLPGNPCSDPFRHRGQPGIALADAKIQWATRFLYSSFRAGVNWECPPSLRNIKNISPRDLAPICPPLPPFPWKVERGRALHGAHQWERAEGSILPCVHPREGPFPAGSSKETAVPAEPKAYGGTCSHALLHRKVSPAHSPSRLRHRGDCRSAPETGRGASGDLDTFISLLPPVVMLF